MRRQLSVFVAAFVLMSFAKSASATIAVDVTTVKELSAATTTLTTPAFSTMAGNELLLAFIATDTSAGATTVKSVVGAGLTWVLVVRTNTQADRPIGARSGPLANSQSRRPHRASFRR